MAAWDAAELEAQRGAFLGWRHPLQQPALVGYISHRFHLAQLRMAIHNRLHRRRSGAAYRQRERHGAPDPAKIPDHALLRVIQSGRDMALVEVCRAERARRDNTTGIER